MTNKIVVTGALGHIGSRLVRALPEAFPGAEITMVDNMATQRYPSLFGLPEGATYRFIDMDVLSGNLERVIAGADVVVHLAALTDAANSFDNKDEVERVNFAATECIAQSCAKLGVALVYPSSTSVYGTQEDIVDEDCSLDELKPQSPYAETKLREEALLKTLKREQGLSYTVCRFGTIFGTSPGMRFHTAVNKFCWQSVMGQPLTVWKTAYNQVRPYLHLDDAVRAIAFLIKNKHFEGATYNVLSANAAVVDIVDIIRARIPSVEIEFVDSKIMNQLSYEVSCRKFSELGFIPTGDLAVGINTTIDLLQGANAAISPPAQKDVVS